MRSILIAATLFIVALLPCSGQAPADGQVQGNAYVNRYFHYSYAWPAFLQPVPTSSMNFHHQASPNEFLLFTARQGDDPFGIILIAEKLHVPTRHTSGIKDVPDFLNRVLQVPDPTRIKVFATTRTKTRDGLIFDEMDYLNYNEYTSTIATQIGEYLLAFRCNAKSKSDLAQMTKSVLASHRLN
jgi:hypothetical protein